MSQSHIVAAFMGTYLTLWMVSGSIFGSAGQNLSHDILGRSDSLSLLLIS
uniref:Uncharacterized protein n=1 Tax=Physcomitrium patens TaxID=3218 RepID=A0A2K1JQT5_PHYPA|nr:hypothetical protein PHYPA_016282 [Physcomitrium patens]